MHRLTGHSTVLVRLMAVGVILAAAGCQGRGDLQRQVNSLLTELQTQDLSARPPTHVKQPTFQPQDRHPPQARVYPSSDHNAGAQFNTKVSTKVDRVGEEYQVNFDNAPIADAAKAILQNILSKAYIVDPRVQGRITLSTGRSVTERELLKVFETSLHMQNAALVKGPDGYRIVPVTEALSGDVGDVKPLRRGEALQPGFGVTVMPLRHISAESMLPLLEGFLARAGSARAEAAGNLILIRGSSEQRGRIVEIIEMFDVNWLKGQSVGIFPLRNANIEDVVGELEQIMQAGQQSLAANTVKFRPIARLNAILVIARRFDNLREAGKWIRRLDKSNSAGVKTYVYRVENGKAGEIADLLNENFGGANVRVKRRRRAVVPGQQSTELAATGAGKNSDNKPQNADNNQTGQSTGQTTTTRSQASRRRWQFARYADPTSAAPEIRIVADETNNTLLIRATRSDYQKVLAVLREIDKAPLQVLINATIAEVTLNDLLRYGVQAYLRSKKGSVGYHPGPVDLTLSPKIPGLNLILGSSLADPRLILDALSNVTAVKVVSSPSVVVVDNHPATLRVGDEVPLATQQAQSVTDPDAPLVNTIQFRETGVILKVTPRINSSGLVTMEVEQEISQVSSSKGAENGSTLTPTISQRKVASTISVYSGQTVVLGGLISEQVNNDRNRVPVLERVPVLGDAVGKTKSDRRRTEIIIFIKPQVIRNSQEAARVSEELRSKLKSMSFDPAPARLRYHRTSTTRRSVKDP